MKFSDEPEHAKSRKKLFGFSDKSKLKQTSKKNMSNQADRVLPSSDTLFTSQNQSREGLSDSLFGDINDQKLPSKDSLYQQRGPIITKYMTTTEIFYSTKEEMEI